MGFKIVFYAFLAGFNNLVNFQRSFEVQIDLGCVCFWNREEKNNEFPTKVEEQKGARGL